MKHNDIPQTSILITGGQSKIWSLMEDNVVDSRFDLSKSSISRMPGKKVNLSEHIELVCVLQAAQIQRISNQLHEARLKLVSVGKKNGQFNNLVVQIKELTDEINSKSNQIELSLAKNLELQEKIVGIQNQLAKSESHAKNLERNLAELHSRYDSSLSSLQAYMTDNETLGSRVSALSVEIKSLNQIISNFRKNAKSAQSLVLSQLNESQKDLSSMHYAKTEQDTQIRRLQEALSTTQIQATERNQQLSLVQAKRNQLDNQIFALQGEIQQINSKVIQERNHHQEELSALRYKHSTEIGEYEYQLRKVKQQLAELETKQEEIKITTNKEQLTVESFQLLSRNGSQIMMSGSMGLTMLSETEIQNFKLKQQILDLQTEVTASKQQISKIKSAKEQIDSLTKLRVTKLQDQLRQKNEQLQQTEKQLAEGQYQLSKIDQELSTAYAKLETLQRQSDMMASVARSAQKQNTESANTSNKHHHQSGSPPSDKIDRVIEDKPGMLQPLSSRDLIPLDLRSPLQFHSGSLGLSSQTSLYSLSDQSMRQNQNIELVQAQIRKRDSQIQLLTMNNEKLTAMLNSSESERSYMSKRHDEVIRQLSDQVQRLQEIIGNQQSQINRKIEQLQRVNKVLVARDQSITKFTAQIQSLRIQSDSFTESMLQLKTISASEKERIVLFERDKMTLQRNKKMFDIEKKTVSDQHQTLQEERQNLHRHASRLQNDASRIDQEQARLLEKERSNQTEQNRLVNERKQLQNQYSMLETQRKHLQAQFNNWVQARKSPQVSQRSNERYSEQQTPQWTISSFSREQFSQNSDSARNDMQRNYLMTTNQQLSSQIAILQEENRKLKSEKRQIDSKLVQQIQRSDELKKEMSQSSLVKSQLVTNNSRLEAQSFRMVQQTAKLRAEKERYQTEFNKAQTQYESLRRQLEQVKADKTRNAMDSTDLSVSLSKAESTIVTLRSQLATLELKMSSGKSQIDFLQLQLQTQRSRAELQLASAKEEFGTLRNSLQQAQTRLKKQEQLKRVYESEKSRLMLDRGDWLKMEKEYNLLMQLQSERQTKNRWLEQAYRLLTEERAELLRRIQIQTEYLQSEKQTKMAERQQLKTKMNDKFSSKSHEGIVTQGSKPFSNGANHTESSEDSQWSWVVSQLELISADQVKLAGLLANSEKQLHRPRKLSIETAANVQVKTKKEPIKQPSTPKANVSCQTRSNTSGSERKPIQSHSPSESPSLNANNFLLQIHRNTDDILNSIKRHFDSTQNQIRHQSPNFSKNNSQKFNSIHKQSVDSNVNNHTSESLMNALTYMEQIISLRQEQHKQNIRKIISLENKLMEQSRIINQLERNWLDEDNKHKRQRSHHSHRKRKDRGDRELSHSEKRRNRHNSNFNEPSLSHSSEEPSQSMSSCPHSYTPSEDSSRERINRIGTHKTKESSRKADSAVQTQPSSHKLPEAKPATLLLQFGTQTNFVGSNVFTQTQAINGEGRNNDSEINGFDANQNSLTNKTANKGDTSQQATSVAHLYSNLLAQHQQATQQIANYLQLLQDYKREFTYLQQDYGRLKRESEQFPELKLKWATEKDHLEKSNESVIRERDLVVKDRDSALSELKDLVKSKQLLLEQNRRLLDEFTKLSSDQRVMSDESARLKLAVNRLQNELENSEKQLELNQKQLQAFKELYNKDIERLNVDYRQQEQAASMRFRTLRQSYDASEATYNSALEQLENNRRHCSSLMQKQNELITLKHEAEDYASRLQKQYEAELDKCRKQSSEQYNKLLDRQSQLSQNHLQINKKLNEVLGIVDSKQEIIRRLADKYQLLEREYSNRQKELATHLEATMSNINYAANPQILLERCHNLERLLQDERSVSAKILIDYEAQTKMTAAGRQALEIERERYNLIHSQLHYQTTQLNQTAARLRKYGHQNAQIKGQLHDFEVQRRKWQLNGAKIPHLSSEIDRLTSVCASSNEQLSLCRLALADSHGIEQKYKECLSLLMILMVEVEASRGQLDRLEDKRQRSSGRKDKSAEKHLNDEKTLRIIRR